MCSLAAVTCMTRPSPNPNLLVPYLRISNPEPRLKAPSPQQFSMMTNPCKKASQVSSDSRCIQHATQEFGASLTDAAYA